MLSTGVASPPRQGLRG